MVVWAFFGIAFLRDWNENWHFPVLWPLLSFPNLLAYWVQHFHSISFQDLKWLNSNSITSTSFVRSDAFLGPLDFTFQDVWLQVSDHTIVIIWVMKIFFAQFFCIFLSPLLNIFCFSRSIPFLSFIDPIFAWNVSLVSLIFLKRSLVFPSLLFSSISLHWSPRKAFFLFLNFF